MRRIANLVVGWILGLAVLFGIAGLTTPPASAEPPRPAQPGKLRNSVTQITSPVSPTAIKRSSTSTIRFRCAKTVATTLW